MARSSAVKNWYSRAKVAYPDSPSLNHYRETFVSFDEAINIIKSTATRSVRVSTQWFGNVDIDKKHAIDKLNDDYLRRHAARWQTEKGVEIGALISIAPIRTYREDAPIKFTVTINLIGYSEDGKEYSIR